MAEISLSPLGAVPFRSLSPASPSTALQSSGHQSSVHQSTEQHSTTQHSSDPCGSSLCGLHAGPSPILVGLDEPWASGQRKRYLNSLRASELAA